MSNKNKLSDEEILRRFYLKHGTKYSYEKMNFIGTRHKIEIVCKSHGSFYQQPHDHCNGRGCPACVGDSIETILHKAAIAHNYKYNYSNVTYDKTNLNNIECSIHGLFNMNKNNHLAKHGCPKCAIDKNRMMKTSSLEKRILQANLVHKNTYLYDESLTTSHSKANIICITHGTFTQTWANHITGKQGCPKCNKTPGRYSNEYFTLYPERKELPASLYVIKMLDVNVVFYKIGISKQLKNRLRVIPYESTIVYQENGNLYDMFIKEQTFLKSYGYRNRYSPKIKFGGDKECFILPEQEILHHLT